MDKMNSMLYRLTLYHKLTKIEKLFHNKQYPESIALCNEILDKGGFFSYYFRGLNNAQLLLYSEAVEDLQTAKKKLLSLNQKVWMNDYLPKIHYQLSMVYFKQQRYGLALEEITKAIDYNARYVDGFLFRAMVKEEFQDMVGAIEDLNAALQIKPNDRSITNYKNLLVYRLTSDKT